MVFFVNNFINIFKVLHIKVHFVKCLIWVAVRGNKEKFLSFNFDFAHIPNIPKL